MGGRHPLGRLVFVAIVCITALAWTIGQCFAAHTRRVPIGAKLIMLGGLILIVVQLIPLPLAWLTVLSPSLADTLPAWMPDGAIGSRLGTWSQLSLVPQATRASLVMYLAYSMLFVLMLQQIRTKQDVERWLRRLGLAAFIMALVGLAQFLAGNGRFLWIYDHPYRDTYGAVRGPFQNENHFTHFLALGLGPLIWWAHRVWNQRVERRQHFRTGSTLKREWQQLRGPAVVAALAVVGLAGLLGYSRGGMVALLLATGVCLGLYAFGALIGKRAAAIFVVVGCVVVGGVFLYGHEQLSNEIDTITEARTPKELLWGRLMLWEREIQAIRDFSFAGTGAGSHREVFPTYFERSHNVVYTHAENGYIQVMLETGILGLALVLAAILLCGWWCIQSMRRSREAIAYVGAISAGLTASVLHSIIDFVWYIPACMSLTIILAACACQLRRLPRAESDPKRSDVPLPRTVCITASLVTAVIGMCAIDVLVGPAQASSHWDHYKVISQRHEDILEAPPESIDLRVTHLESAIERDPTDAQAHLRLAGLCLHKFYLEQQSSENNMPLTQIRDAALASEFPSREALDDWLLVAVGDHVVLLNRARFHAYRAVCLCPLLGEGYVHLEELMFLEGSRRSDKTAYIDQAVKVRPYSAAVNFAAGQEAALDGDFDRAITHFKVAYEQEPYLQSRIVEMFGQQGPEFFLENFEPDLKAMGLLRAHYRRLGRKDDAKKITIQYVNMLQQQVEGKEGEEAARSWRSLQRLYDELGEHDRAVNAARQAVVAAPNDYESRRCLATVLLEEEKFAEAARHLQWCLLQYPESQELRQQLELARRSASTATRDQRGTQQR